MENFFNSYRLLDIEPISVNHDADVCRVSLKNGYVYFPSLFGKELEEYKKMNVMTNDITGDIAFVFVKDEAMKGFLIAKKSGKNSSKLVSNITLVRALAKLYKQENDFKLRLGENQSRNPNVIFRSAKLA